MNELVVVATPAHEHYTTGEPMFQLGWIVDGHSLLNLVREAELPTYSEAGFPDSAGSYQGVWEDRRRGPEHLELMQVAREDLPAELLYVCSCGIEDCSAIVTTVSRSDGVVTWAHIRPANGAVGAPRPFAHPIPDLVFDADAYDRVFATPLRAEGPHQSYH